MLKKLLASFLTATMTAFILASVTTGQTRSPNLTQHWRYRKDRGIDDGMVKRAPVTRDEKMARKAPEHIDDGIFIPKRVFRSYGRIVKPQKEKK